MLSQEIFDMLGRAIFGRLNENVLEQGVVTEVRFVREDWVRKTIKTERLQRLLHRGDIFHVETKISRIRYDWKKYMGMFLIILREVNGHIELH